MTTSDELFKYRRSGRYFLWAGTFIQSVVTVLATLLIFFATLQFIHALRPLNGLGAQLIEATTLTIDGFIAHTISPIVPAIDRAAGLFFVMMISLVATISAPARDSRVHLISLVLAVAAFATVYIYTIDVSAAANADAGAMPVGAVPYAGISILCIAALVGVSMSFRLRHVPRRKSQAIGKRREQFLMIYWALVAVLCIFEFFFLMTGPQSSGEEAGSAIMFIAVAAGVLLLGMYMIASVLIFAQIILWNGMLALNDNSSLSLVELTRHPLPSPVDPAIYPAASLTFLGLMLFTWLGYTICAISGAVNTTRLVTINSLAIFGAIATAILASFF